MMMEMCEKKAEMGRRIDAERDIGLSDAYESSQGNEKGKKIYFGDRKVPGRRC